MAFFVDELEPGGPGLARVGAAVWDWLAAPAHRRVLTLWLECYARSLLDGSGPRAGFAAATVAAHLAQSG